MRSDSLNNKLPDAADGRKSKDPCLDYLRAAACLLVVVIHTTSRYLVEPGREAYRLLFSGLNTFAGSAVAVFIFISGVALTLRYHQQILEWGPFVKRRLRRILWPFILWSLFYLVVINRGLWITYGPLSLAGTFLGFSMYHLYYIVIILQLYLIYPLLLRLHQKLPYGWLPVLFFLLGIWFEKQTVMVGPWRITDRLCLTYGGYFSLGIYAGLVWPRWRQVLGKARSWLFILWIILGTMATIQVFTQFSPWYADMNLLGGYRYMIFAVASILWLSTAADSLSEKEWPELGKKLKGISRLSLDIYFVHPLLLGVADRIWAKLPAMDDILRFMITFSCVFAGAVVFAAAKEKLANKTRIVKGVHCGI